MTLWWREFAKTIIFRHIRCILCVMSVFNKAFSTKRGDFRHTFGAAETKDLVSTAQNAKIGFTAAFHKPLLPCSPGGPNRSKYVKEAVGNGLRVYSPQDAFSCRG